MKSKRNFWLIPIKIYFLLILSSMPLLAKKTQNDQSDNSNRLLGLPGSLKGKIVLQGHPQGNMAASLTVQVFEPNKTSPAFTYDIWSDTNGEFLIENISEGNYVVTVKNSHTLSVAAAATITQGYVTVIEFDPLLEGDANNDNHITELDFSLLSKAFGTFQGGNGYNSNADFNVDTVISILDFSLLAGNYNKKGYQIAESSYSELSSGGNIGFFLEASDDRHLQANLSQH